MESKCTPIIGICGGVGPAAGLLLHQNILLHTDNNGTDQGHLDIVHISRSRDCLDRTSFLLGNGSENPAVGMSRTLEMIRELIISRKEDAVVGVPCNTFHATSIWHEFCHWNELNQHPMYKIHLVNMLEETIKLIHQIVPDCTHVGLLCTSGTRDSKVYETLLHMKSYTVHQVSLEVQEELHESIYHPEWGIKATAPIVTTHAIENFKKYATHLANEGAQVIILGCTEIPFAFHGVEQVGNAILLDPMVALARGLIEKSSKNKLMRMPLIKRKRPGFDEIKSRNSKPVFGINVNESSGIVPSAVSMATPGGSMGLFNDFVDKVMLM